MDRIRLLFNAWADEGNVNAQNLNARDIAKRLNPDRFHISLFCSGNPDAELQQRENIRIIYLPKRLGTLRILTQMLFGDQHAIFYMRYHRADKIYMNLIKRIANINKVIISPIESQLDKLDISIEQRKLERFYDNVAAVSDILVPNSPFVAQTVFNRYGISCPVIYSGVDVDYFRQLPKRINETHREQILFAGTFQERKNPQLVLDLAKHFPNANFILMGDGPLKSAIEKRIREEGLSNVKLNRTEKYSDYAKIVAASDIFIFPSRVEGLPKVTLEAAAAGKPIVMFDDYESPSVCHNQTGFKVKTFEEMANALKLLIDNDGLRIKMGEAATRHAEQFDWKMVVGQWENLFEKMIRENQAGKRN